MVVAVSFLSGLVVLGVAVGASPCSAVSQAWAAGWTGLGSRCLRGMARWCELCWRARGICDVVVEEVEGAGVSVVTFAHPWAWAPRL